MDVKIVFLIVSLVNFATAELLKGKTCSHEETGSQGICKYIAECQEALEIVTRGSEPQSCGLDGSKPVVCCPESSVAKDEEKKEETKTESRIPGQIAKEKCREYNKYVWTIKPSPITLIGDDDVKTNECPYNVTELIIGGTEASRKEFPHMVLIGYDLGDGRTAWDCGGSLISEQFVLTAAHCLKGQQQGEAKFAKMGFIDQEKDDDEVQEFVIVERISHPNYNPRYSEYDIGLIKLNKQANLNSWVRPACLYTESFTPKSKAIVSGWGKVGAGNQSRFLLKALLDFVGPVRCHPPYIGSGKFKVTNGTIDENLIVCAGSSGKNFSDSCKGDSGGPLQVYNTQDDATMNCMYDIVGVVSYGYKCEDELRVPATYTRVSHFVKWIEDIVWPSS